MNKFIHQEENHASNIYEGGGISEIKAEELKNNLVAIRQLINSHNLVATENRNKEREVQRIQSENEYLKTSPFVSIISAVVSIFGSILVAIEVNVLTSNQSQSNINYIILVIGIIMLLVSSLANILYPKAREWFNPSSNSTT